MDYEQRLHDYVDRAFAGTTPSPAVREAKSELTADLVDKYRTLVAQGHSPSGAYEATIAGVGDIFEVVDQASGGTWPPAPPPPAPPRTRLTRSQSRRRIILWAVALLLALLCWAWLAGVFQGLFSPGPGLGPGTGPGPAAPAEPVAPPEPPAPPPPPKTPR